MISYKYLIIICLSLFIQSVSGQKVDWQKLKADYPSEDYIYLSKEVKIEFVIEKGKVVIYEHVKDQKLLLSEKAKLYESMSIPYSNLFAISDLEAKSHVPKGNKYKSYKVKNIEDVQLISEDFFYDDSRVKSFIFPNVTMGTICEVSYTRRTDNPIFVPRVFLVSNAPILNLSINVESNKRIDLSIYEYTYPSGIKALDLNRKGEVVYQSNYTNVKPIYKEFDGPSFISISPHLIFNANKYIDDDGNEQMYMNDVNDLYREYYSFINQIDTSASQEIHAVVDSIIIGLTTEKEIVKSIYYWVQSNIKYIAFEDEMNGFIPRDPQLVFDRKFGDCKDKSTLVIKMLDIVGIRANYAWTGTRDIPYKYSEVCGAMVDNHMIAMYYSEIEDQYYFLDATDTNLPFGIPPLYLQGKEILIERGAGDYDIITAELVDCTVNMNKESCKLTIEDDVLKGHVETQMTGYEYGRYQEIFGNYTKAQLEKRYQTYFARGNNKSTVYNIDVITKPDNISTSFDIDVRDYLTSTKDEIFINMNLERIAENQKILSDKKYPLNLEQTYNYIRDYYLEIPQGYQVEYIPENSEYNTADYSYNINYTHQNNIIHYSLNLCQNTISIEPTSFDQWNKFIQGLKKNYSENVILKKK